jgi:nitroreductase
MTNALEAIFQRRAVKIFDAVEIPADVRNQILDAARVAPSSFNIQPYRDHEIVMVIAIGKKSVRHVDGVGRSNKRCASYDHR